jgi:hypothetical protein
LGILAHGVSVLNYCIVDLFELRLDVVQLLLLIHLVSLELVSVRLKAVPFHLTELILPLFCLDSLFVRPASDLRKLFHIVDANCRFLARVAILKADRYSILNLLVPV